MLDFQKNLCYCIAVNKILVKQIKIYKYLVYQNEKSARDCRHLLVGEGGFEPPKPKATDLQSAPFDLEFPHMKIGAGGRIRTPDLLITNQLLYQLSYTSSSNSRIYLTR